MSEIIKSFSVGVGFYSSIVLTIPTLISRYLLYLSGGSDLFGGMTSYGDLWFNIYRVCLVLLIIALLLFLISSLVCYLTIDYEDYGTPETFGDSVLKLAIGFGYRTIWIIAYVLLFIWYYFPIPFRKNKNK